MVLARPTAPHKRSNCSANQHSSGVPSSVMLCQGLLASVPRKQMQHQDASCKAVHVSITTHFFVLRPLRTVLPCQHTIAGALTRGKLLRQGESAGFKTLPVPEPDGPESWPADPIAQGSPGITAPGSLANSSEDITSQACLQSGFEAIPKP